MSPNSYKTHLQWSGSVFLALVAGYLDGYGLLFLKTYVSFMSGNTTSTGVMIGSGRFASAFNSGLAVVCFVIGALVGSLVAQSRFRHVHRVAFVSIAAILAIVAGLEWNGPGSTAVEIALLCVAMGMVNPALSKVGKEAVSLTFVTGGLTRMSGHLASAFAGKPLADAEGEGDSHLRRAGIAGSIWGGFIGGALLAGLLLSHVRAWALLLPCAVMVLLALLSDRAPAPAKPRDGSVGIVPQESR